MIREQFIMSVGPVASELPLLVPKNNTLLAEAVGSLRGPLNVLTGDKAPDLSEYSREVDKLYEGQNDTMLDAIAGHASDILKDTMALARSVVNPAIQDAAARAQGLVNGRADEFMSDDITITAVKKSEVWRSQTLYQATEPYSSAAAEDFNVQGYYEEREEIPVSLLVESIPSASIAKEISEMLGDSENAGKDLARVFNAAFACQRTGDINFSYVMRDFFNKGQEEKDAHILIWAMAKALLAPTGKMAKTILPSENTPPELVGSYLSTLVEQMSVRIINTIYDEMRREKRGIDRVTYETIGLGREGQLLRKVSVERNAYNRWLDAGGTPEMAMGSALSGRYASLQEIKEDGARLESVYSRYRNTQKATRDTRELVVIREVMVNVCMDMIQEMDPEVLTEDMALYLKRLKDCANALTKKTMHEYIENTRSMICHAAFAHTQVKEFLCSMDDFARDNPGMPPRECARLAAEQILSSWLADQITTNQDRPNIDTVRNNECILTTMAEIVVRTMDSISGNEVASGLDGELPILSARADMAMAAVRNEIQKAA